MAITRYGTSGYGIRKTGSFAGKTETEAVGDAGKIIDVTEITKVVRIA